MKRVVRDYFTNVFAGNWESDMMRHSSSPRRLSREQNVQLIQEITFEEFTVAIHQMHPDKASGPDGLNPAFYQHFWQVMGREVFGCCNKWLQGEAFPADLNCTNVVLIPKKEGACRMRDLRPIALC